MSPESACLLLHNVVPRLRSAIPIAVAHVGSEDDAELLQDGTVMAAKILTNATRKGKRVTAGNVAFYTLQHMKSGRRTVGYSGVDVLPSGTQLNGRSTVSSIHEKMPMCSETAVGRCHRQENVSQLGPVRKNQPEEAFKKNNAERSSDFLETTHSSQPAAQITTSAPESPRTGWEPRTQRCPPRARTGRSAAPLPPPRESGDAPRAR